MRCDCTSRHLLCDIVFVNMLTHPILSENDDLQQNIGHVIVTKSIKEPSIEQANVWAQSATTVVPISSCKFIKLFVVVI